MQIIRVRLINGETKGCEKAPVEVLKELRNIGSSESGKIIDVDKLNLEEIHVDLNNLKEADYLIFENSKEIFERNFKAFFIGGDHSISYPIVRAFNKIEKNPLLVVFDAHVDCLSGGKIPKSREWLNKLICEGFNSGSILFIGPRNVLEEEIEFLKENKITAIKMDVIRDELNEVCDLVMERARESSGFYVSIDIDCVDPGFAPGTNHLEPGGLSSGDLIYFIKRLALLSNFKGGDIVNINPDLDFNNMTVKLGAKLLAEMI